MDWLRSRRQISGYHLLLAGVFALALFLRFFGQNWDQGIYLHPDERFIAIVSSDRVAMPPLNDIWSILDPATSSLNPRRDDMNGNPESFAYGTLPIYVQGTVSWLLSLASDTEFGSYQQTYRVGRPLTALVDMFTLLFVFLLARRLAGRYAALVAAALYALAVLPIQLSHFFAVDIWLTCFVVATIYLAVRYTDAPTLWRAMALAVPVGCAFATKASVPSLLVPLAATFGWVLWKHPHRLEIVGHALGAGVASLAVFTVFEPYALVRFQPFTEDIRTQARIVRGQFDVPFTRQFVGLTPGLYELRNMFLFTLGPALLVSGIAGFFLAARRAISRMDVAWILPVLWVVAYVPILIATEARFLRYSLPLVPFISIFAATLLIGLPRIGRVPLARVATALVLIITATWAVGFVSIYARENPRIAASKWMNANIPVGSAITAETWDDAMPVPYPGAPPNGYTLVSSDIYQDAPPEEKVRSIAQTLLQADYVVLSSDRVIESVDNLPWRYAVQNEYYRRLLAGQLGFQLVYDGQLRPQLFGYRYDDSSADESFTVYDHPRVRIFKKVADLSEAEIRERLLWGLQQPWEPQRYPSEKWLQLDQPVDTITVTTDASWNSLAVDNTVLAIVFWLVAVEAIGLAALPLAAVLLPRTPDRGAASARLLGLLIVGWTVWIGASLRFWEARATTVVIATGLLAFVCWAVADSRSRSGRPLRLPTWKTWLNWSAIWLGGFATFLLLRAMYPDFWQTWFGGEKPFELAYLRAVARSVEFPPYDPWYSGGTINYYYYGWHLVSTLAKLSGVGISLAFQFAIPTFAGMLILQVASIATLLIGRGRSRLTRIQLLTGGTLAVLAVVVIGNLDALRQVWELRGNVRDGFDFWRSTRVIAYTINEFPWFSQIWADVHPHVINFPIFALLLTVLAHLSIASPRGILVSLRAWLFWALPSVGMAGLVFGSVAMTNSWDAPLGAGMCVVAFTYAGWLHSGRAALVGTLAGGGAVVLGLILFWPFYAGFYSVVQGLNVADAGSNLAEFLTVWGISFGIIMLAMLARLAQRLRAGGDVRDGWLFAALTLIVGGLLTGVGLFIDAWDGPSFTSVVALFLAAAAIGVAAGVSQPTSLRPFLLEPIVLGVVIAGGISVWRPAAAVALAISIGCGMFAARRLRQPSAMLPWALCALGAVVIAATEVVYVADDLQHSPWERMNTVFKFYLQAWTLLAIGSAVLLAELLRRARLHWPPGSITTAPGVVAQPDVAPGRGMSRPIVPSVRRIWAISALSGALLLSTGLTYTVFGTPVRLDQDMPSSPAGLSLDGYAWMSGGEIRNGTNDVMHFSGDLAAIEWLNANVHGNPVILEGSIGPYRGNGGRISSATGLPTVLGWDRHQRQQRYGPGIDARMRDVRQIYNETDPERKLEMLRRYRVTYVVVGDVERLWNTPDNPEYYASAEGLTTFDALTSRGLFPVFESGTTRIYVLQDFPRVPPAADALHYQ